MKLNGSHSSLKLQIYKVFLATRFENTNLDTMKIKYLFTLLVAFAFNAVHAQRIAVVDINQVLGQMSEYKAAQTEVDRVAAEWRQEISQEMDKIKSLYNKFQAEQVLLSDEAKKLREEEIVKKEEQVRELQKRRFGPEGDLFKKRQQLVAPIQDKVFAAIEAYAADKGYDLIFDKAGSTGLLFSNPDFDKTEDLKKRVNN